MKSILETIREMESRLREEGTRYKIPQVIMDMIERLIFMATTTISVSEERENEARNSRENLLRLNGELTDRIGELEYELSFVEGQRNKWTEAIETTPIDRSMQDEVTCYICLDSIEKYDRIPKLECSHSMHYECYAQYIFFNDRCGICRRDLRSIE